MIKKILCIKKTSIVRAGGRRFRFVVYLILKVNNFYGLGIGRSSDLHRSILNSTNNALSRLKKLYNCDSVLGKCLFFKIGKTLVKLYFPFYNVGFIVGGYSRLILDFIGIYNVYGIILGTRNIYNVIIATFNLLIINDF